MTTVQTGLSYDPNATLEVSSQDVEYRRDGDTVLIARIYQPEGPGPFPAMVAVHGGAWAGKEWVQNEPSHQALAAGGLVVMAIQFRTSMDAPHPAAQQDINYATRWLKTHASEFNASPDQVGGIGWSSGGHQIMLSAQREDAYLYRDLATLRTDAPLFESVDELRWAGPTEAFEAWCSVVEAPVLLERATALMRRVTGNR